MTRTHKGEAHPFRRDFPEKQLRGKVSGAPGDFELKFYFVQRGQFKTFPVCVSSTLSREQFYNQAQTFQNNSLLLGGTRLLHLLLFSDGGIPLGCFLPGV